MIVAFCLGLCGSPAFAQRVSVDELLAPVVQVKTIINPDARTTKNLGREREGSGIVIDDNGLVLTIGYLMVEAHAAEIITNDGRTIPANIVGYDHETGFGLLQAIAPLKVKAMQFGKSSELKKDDVGADRKLRRGRRVPRRRASRPSANSPGAGNICSTKRSSPRRRIRPGAAPR